RQYYNPDTVSVGYQSGVSSFFIKTTPVIEYYNVTPNGDGGWGEPYFFYINVSDEDGDDMDVYLFVEYTTGWVQRNSSLNVNGVNQSVMFYHNPLFTAGTQIGTRRYRIEVDDDHGYHVETANISFSVYKDNTSSIYYMGNGTEIYRPSPGSFKFGVQVWDVDRLPNTTPGSRTGKFWLTKDRQNFTMYPTTAEDYRYTNGSGVMLIDENKITIDCDFEVGPQLWFGGLTADNYYKDSNSTNFTFIITTDNLSANLTIDNVSYLAGVENVTLRVNVSDECFEDNGGVVGACVVFTIPDVPYTCPVAGCAT
ncbi:unnamed protein product, partial [marine sediment metagenome]